MTAITIVLICVGIPLLLFFYFWIAVFLGRYLRYVSSFYPDAPEEQK